MMIGIGIGTTLARSRGGFSLDAYLASLADGFFFDFTKTDRHFQEAVGPTLADDVGEPIGLAMDSRTWDGQTLAGLVAATAVAAANPNFDSDTAWTKASGVTITDGEVVFNTGALSSDQPLVTQNVVTAFKTYRVEWQISQTLNRLVAPRVGLTFGTSQTAIGTYVEYITAGNNPTVGLFTRGASSVTTGSVTLLSVKEVPGKHGVQATGNLKGTRQAAGCKYDGGDDNHGVPYRAGAGSNFIMALMTPPASIPATQMVAGVQGGASDRFRMEIGTGGSLSFSLGTQLGVGAPAVDVRGREVVAAVSCDGSFGQVFVDDQVGTPFVQSGNPNTTLDFVVGAFSSSGTPANFFGGAIKKIIVGRDHLTPARFQQIRSRLLA